MLRMYLAAANQPSSFTKTHCLERWSPECVETVWEMFFWPEHWKMSMWWVGITILINHFYLICSLQIQLVNVYLVGLCLHWKSVFFVKLQPLSPARTWNCIFLVNICLCQKGAVVQLPRLTRCCRVKEQSTLTRSFPQSQASETTPDKGSQSRLLWQQQSRDAAEILSSVPHRRCIGVAVSVTGKPCPVGMREEGKTMWCRD